jgi:hypothetical protein
LEDDLTCLDACIQSGIFSLVDTTVSYALKLFAKEIALTRI